MLQCTRAAADTLEQVRSQQGLPEGVGIRLFPSEVTDGRVGLGLEFADTPAEGDQVTEQHGTRVIVAPEIAEELADLTLDVIPDPSSNGQSAPQLVLRPRTE